ncbi:MAG TPA: DUF4213 domain-containing protein, partial [Anaerolineae bacterium]|nr:DUF4213 domain-containing protein [Anaerolineae bacterium]
MTLIERVLHEVAPVAAEATPVEVIIGAYWTLTTISHRGTLYGGLSSTLGGGDEHHHGGGHAVRQAGHLLELPVTALADLARSANPLEASVGMATLNALLAVTP